MGLHLPNIPTLLTPIPDTSRGQHWLGERPSPWVAHGPTTGAIAIGTTAMGPSTTTTISIRTITRTSTKDLVLAKPTAGSTTRNTGETRLTPANKQRISTAARLAVRPGNRQLEPGNPVVPAVRVALVVLENPAVLAVQVALVVLGNPAVPAVQVVL